MQMLGDPRRPQAHVTPNTCVYRGYDPPRLIVLLNAKCQDLLLRALHLVVVNSLLRIHFPCLLGGHLL
jgi:hypothetical protein